MMAVCRDAKFVDSQLGIAETFTSDHHFTQAGFVRVP